MHATWFRNTLALLICLSVAPLIACAPTSRPSTMGRSPGIGSTAPGYATQNPTADSIKLAEKLVAAVEKQRLTDDEDRQLAKLGDIAYGAIFRRAKEIQSDHSSAIEDDHGYGHDNPFARLCGAISVVMKG